ncbi:DVU_2496 family lipoprotein [Vogesella sp. GCM10023246]|uniref:DVU_2496 family lipoprotein n=1 Tax=Vogesella oryzagri TaxID=3160864 RepID=A0ABV1M3I9_9NEIS
MKILILPLLLTAVLAGCQRDDCTAGVFVLSGTDFGDVPAASVAAMPGRLPPGKLPAGLQPSADGHYPGTKAYCSALAARSDYRDALKGGHLQAGKPWYVYRLDARWPQDVYPYREADWRLKAPARLLKKEETHGSGN